MAKVLLLPNLYWHQNIYIFNVNMQYKFEFYLRYECKQPLHLKGSVNGQDKIKPTTVYFVVIWIQQHNIDKKKRKALTVFSINDCLHE